MRYIRFYHIKNTMNDYENINFRVVLRATAVSLGYLKDNQIEYKKTKEYICNYIKEHYGIHSVSKKQISRMISPRKHRFSKYGAIYIAAMYNILLEKDDFKQLHTDICCLKQQDKLYTQFSLDRILDIIRMYGDVNDPDVAYFMDKVNAVNRHLPETTGVLFSTGFDRVTRGDIPF